MQLNDLCGKLKFDHLPAQLDTLCEQAAKRELNYREFLAEVLGTEWQGRRLKGVERGLRLARFPYIKTLEQFDLGFQPSIDRKLVRELAGLGFVERGDNLLLLGPPGTGKTMLAVALGIKAIEAGHRVLFLTLETLIAAAPGSGGKSAGVATATMGRAQAVDRRRAGLPADEPRGSQPVLPPGGTPLRARQPHHHLQQELYRLGRGLRRPGAGHRDPGPSAPPFEHYQHQGRELSAQGKTPRGPARQVRSR